MSFNTRKINNVLKLANEYSKAVLGYVKFAQEDNSLLNSMISLNAAIKDLAVTVKLTDPNDPDMKSLVRSGGVLIDDFQNTSLPSEHFIKRLYNMRKHLDVVKVMNYFIEEENIYDGGITKTPNTALFQKANIVSEKFSQVEEGLKNYKGKSGPVVPRKTFAPKPTPKPQVVQPSSSGQAYMADNALEKEKQRILSEVDAGEYDLEDMSAEMKNSNSLSQKALQQLREEQKEFGFSPSPAGASQEELDAVVDRLVDQKRNRY